MHSSFMILPFFFVREEFFFKNADTFERKTFENYLSLIDIALKVKVTMT